LELTQPKLRFTHTVILPLQINIYPIHKPRIDLNRDKQADTKREIVESSDTDAFVVRLGEYGRDRRQEHLLGFKSIKNQYKGRGELQLTVKDAIDKSHVHPKQLHDEFSSKDHERSREGLFEDLGPPRSYHGLG